MCIHSPNSFLPTWGPSGESLYRLWPASFSLHRPPRVLKDFLGAVNIFEVSLFEMLLWPRQITQNEVRAPLRRTAPIHFLAVASTRIIISKSVIVRQPSLSHKSSKNIKEIHHTLGASFVAKCPSSVLAKFHSNHKHRWIAPFCWRVLVFHVCSVS